MDLYIMIIPLQCLLSLAYATQPSPEHITPRKLMLNPPTAIDYGFNQQFTPPGTSGTINIDPLEPVKAALAVTQDRGDQTSTDNGANNQNFENTQLPPTLTGPPLPAGSISKLPIIPQVDNNAAFTPMLLMPNPHSPLKPPQIGSQVLDSHINPESSHTIQKQGRSLQPSLSWSDIFAQQQKDMFKSAVAIESLEEQNEQIAANIAANTDKGFTHPGEYHPGQHQGPIGPPGHYRTHESTPYGSGHQIPPPSRRHQKGPHQNPAIQRFHMMQSKKQHVQQELEEENRRQEEVNRALYSKYEAVMQGKMSKKAMYRAQQEAMRQERMKEEALRQEQIREARRQEMIRQEQMREEHRRQEMQRQEDIRKAMHEERVRQEEMRQESIKKAQLKEKIKQELARQEKIRQDAIDAVNRERKKQEAQQKAEALKDEIKRQQEVIKHLNEEAEKKKLIEKAVAEETARQKYMAKHTPPRHFSKGTTGYYPHETSRYPPRNRSRHRGYGYAKHSEEPTSYQDSYQVQA